MSLKKYYPIFGLILFVIVFQLFLSLIGKEFFLTQLTMAAYYALVIVGLTVLMGYTGQISIGHAAFFAIGGYTTSVLTANKLSGLTGAGVAQFLMNIGMTTIDKDPYGTEIVHLSPWAALTFAIIITALIAFLIGIPILKLKGHYLAMATLGFGTIVYRVVLGTEIFGGADGISDVPPFRLFGNLAVAGDSSMRIENYYIAWFVVILCVVLLLNLINSRVGRALRSIHGSEEAANAMGVDTARYKLAIFVLSAVFASVGGVFLAHYNGGIGPSEAGVMKSVRYVAIVAVGGMANLWGALIMGIVLNFLSLRGYFGSYDDAFFGVILIVIMIFYPDGIFKQENFKGLIKTKLLKRKS
ncbi:MAG: branched-chain amino acid ABC transporter permease [bacterium]|nr:branched-chain amino acid ABC transporter permease [bacterium]